MVFLLTVAFSGCTKSEPPATSTAAQQPASPPATPASAPAPASTPPPSAVSGATPVPVDGDLPGVRIAVNELKRTSTTVTLKFTVYNTSDKGFSTQGVFDGDGYHRYRHVGAIHLIDEESKKKYFVVTDSDGSLLCSDNISDIAPKSQITLWAKFPAPPSEIKKITVEIPHFVPFEDVVIVQ
ncbi:MAG: hypothetical protein P4L56_29515 [Candidatus Sulfopaludibacter sp.]|nr:hypothetical protein [Candidatus Sulfopaludibacter sp.]